MIAHGDRTRARRGAMNEFVMLGIGLVLTVGTGLFVASEFSLVNLDRYDLEARQARGEKRLAPTIKALRITSTHLSGAQLGITLTTLLTGYTFEPAISSLLGGPLDAPSACPRPSSPASAPSSASCSRPCSRWSSASSCRRTSPSPCRSRRPSSSCRSRRSSRPSSSRSSCSSTTRPTPSSASMGIEPKEELSGARSRRGAQLAGAPLRARGHARRRPRDAAGPHAALLGARRGRRA